MVGLSKFKPRIQSQFNAKATNNRFNEKSGRISTARLLEEDEELFRLYLNFYSNKTLDLNVSIIILKAFLSL